MGLSSGSEEELEKWNVNGSGFSFHVTGALIIAQAYYLAFNKFL
jgi:hypothetical protein